MPTLWEILTKPKKVEVPLELQYYNPLKAKIGDSMRISTLDLQYFAFRIVGMREIKRTIDGLQLFFTDYDLRCNPNLDEVIDIRLRVMPLSDTSSGVSHRVLLLNKIGECVYDKSFHEGLDFKVNGGEFTEGDNTYYRIDDVKIPWTAKTVTLVDSDNSGKIDLKEVQKGNLTYWDFWRTVAAVNGTAQIIICEFYFVEMDENGFFEFYLGSGIDLTRVSIL